MGKPIDFLRKQDKIHNIMSELTEGQFSASGHERCSLIVNYDVLLEPVLPWR